jgi:hypothetical protein
VVLTESEEGHVWDGGQGEWVAVEGLIHRGEVGGEGYDEMGGGMTMFHIGSIRWRISIRVRELVEPGEGIRWECKLEVGQVPCGRLGGASTLGFKRQPSHTNKHAPKRV